MTTKDRCINEPESRPQRSCNRLRKRQDREVQPGEVEVRERNDRERHDRERHDRARHDREKSDREGHDHARHDREGSDREHHEREGHDFQSCHPAPTKTRALAPEGIRPSSSTPPSTLLRWCKFNLVGAIGIAVQFAALFLLKSILHWNYLAATALAVEAAVVHNFIWHEQFTWADRIRFERLTPFRTKSLLRFARFNLTAGAVSLVGNLALMKLMVGIGQMNYLLANAIAIALSSVANFLVSEQWVFRTE